MNREMGMICLVAISCLVVWSVGCSKKSIQSGGNTVKSSPAPIGTAPDSSMTGSPDAAPDLSTASSADAERLSSGMAMAKADPGTARRQMNEMRAEQAATAAAGLRDVFFAYDSWVITEEGRQALTGDAEWLRVHPAVRLKVEGHCDERGSSSYNFILAEKRAKSVRNYLTELGVRPDRLMVVSYGKERPFCKDHTESCYQQNRRGHLVVRP